MKSAEAISPVVLFQRDISNDLAAAERREWLVTNGIGGFASGTVAGSFTRRYHGLLIAALKPPLGRTYLVGGIDEVVNYQKQEFQLATHHWASGVVAPSGYSLIEEFRLNGMEPVWTYSLADARLEKRVFMGPGENTTFVRYQVLGGSAEMHLDLKVLVNYRDFHNLTIANDWRMAVERVDHGVWVKAYDGATGFYLRARGAECDPLHIWYRDCQFPLEKARGLEDREDQLLAAAFHVNLQVGQSVTVELSTEETMPAEIGRRTTMREPGQRAEPAWQNQLVVAADQFIVKRALPGEPDGCSVIAGYHWFGDWGRDTMIALPGLSLATGRPEIAKKTLLAFAGYVDGGMLPNDFPDQGGSPGYNTMDAGLWYFESSRSYVTATRDLDTLQKLFPVLAGIIEAHVQGTRYNIHVDPSDWLLYGGEPGVQLTWMDAKIGDWVVTPRVGKPVEINALWINALATMVTFAKLLKMPSERYEDLGRQAYGSFQRFWNTKRNCCFDVIDAPGFGNDGSMRPNQIFAAALPVSPLSAEQQKGVVDACSKHLLTPVGLRSLAPGENGYIGRYRGGPRERDASYHQGSVWAWLLGPYALAHFRVYKDRAAARKLLETLGSAIDKYGLGTLGEIFDGDAPHEPCGAIAQAWSVGEVLRAWRELEA